MKLNCDMGEAFGRYSFGHDEYIMPHIHMANVACGFHAGDPGIMKKTVARAVSHNVEIGAHPSYPDVQGFGRRNMELSPKEVYGIVIYQAGALEAFCRAGGSRLSYIKPHGALYNTMMREEKILSAIMEAVASYNPQLRLMIQASTHWKQHKKMAAKHGIELYLEAFADRSYEEDGSLRNRSFDDALLTEKQVLARVELLCNEGIVEAVSGKSLEFPVDVLCVHGDSPAGVKQIREIRDILDRGQRDG